MASNITLISTIIPSYGMTKEDNGCIDESKLPQVESILDISTGILKKLKFQLPAIIYFGNMDEGIITVPADHRNKKGHEETCDVFDAKDKEELFSVLKFCHKILSHMNSDGSIRTDDHSSANNWYYDEYNLGKDLNIMKREVDKLHKKFYDDEEARMAQEAVSAKKEGN